MPLLMLLNVLVLPSKVSFSLFLALPLPHTDHLYHLFSFLYFVSLQCTTPLPDKCILLELTTIPTPIPPLPMYDLLSFHLTHILTLTLTLTLTPRPHPSSSPLPLSPNSHTKTGIFDQLPRRISRHPSRIHQTHCWAKSEYRLLRCHPCIQLPGKENCRERRGRVVRGGRGCTGEY